MATASASDGQWISAALRANSTSGGIRPSASRLMPVMRPSWPMRIESEMPAKKPIRIGRDRKVERTPRPSNRAAEVETADGEGEERRHCRPVRGLEPGHRREDGGHDGDGGGVGADDELARRAKDRIGDERSDRRVEPGLGRQTGDCRIGDGARQADRGDGEPGGDVGLDPSRPVAGKARQDRPGREGFGHRSAAAGESIDRARLEGGRASGVHGCPGSASARTAPTPVQAATSSPKMASTTGPGRRPARPWGCQRSRR